jgi:hypothetical protein
MKLFLTKLFPIFLVASVIAITILVIPLEFKFDTRIKVISQSKIDSAQILILGDSRAERQLDPEIIHSKTNLDVLNIAESSMDLYSLSLRLRELNVENKLIIISASSWQVNDGSTDEGYFRIEAFNELTSYEKLQLYADNPIELKKILTQCLFSQFEVKELTIGNEARFINRGFENMKCSNFDSKNMFHNHAWYRNMRLNGIKTKLLIEALSELNNLKCRGVLIYNAPAYSEFNRQSKYNGVEDMENTYCNMISNYIKSEDLSHISFRDLRNLTGFSKNDYYDPLHFCEQGAKKFTLKFIDVLREVMSGDCQNRNQKGKKINFKI